MPAQAGAAHNCPLGQLRQVLGGGGDECVSNILARQIAGQNGAGWQISGDVLFVAPLGCQDNHAVQSCQWKM